MPSKWFPVLFDKYLFDKIEELPNAIIFPVERGIALGFRIFSEVEMMGILPSKSSNGFFSGGDFLCVHPESPRDLCDEKINSLVSKSLSSELIFSIGLQRSV